jgi:hypothetical protein
VWQYWWGEADFAPPRGDLVGVQRVVDVDASGRVHGAHQHLTSRAALAQVEALGNLFL